MGALGTVRGQARLLQRLTRFALPALPARLGLTCATGYTRRPLNNPASFVMSLLCSLSFYVVLALQAMASREWPRDALLRRRRSVLFAFTFSPPAGYA